MLSLFYNGGWRAREVDVGVDDAVINDLVGAANVGLGRHLGRREHVTYLVAKDLHRAGLTGGRWDINWPGLVGFDGFGTTSEQAAERAGCSRRMIGWFGTRCLRAVVGERVHNGFWAWRTGTTGSKDDEFVSEFLFPVASETENGAQLGIAGQQDATRVGFTNRELGRLLYLRCKPRTASCQLPKPASARGFRSQGYAKSLLPRDQWPDSCSFGVAQHSFPRCSRTFNFRRKRNGTESTAATVAAWSGLRAPSHTRSAQGEVFSTPMVSTIRRGALTYELLQCKEGCVRRKLSDIGRESSDPHRT